MRDAFGRAALLVSGMMMSGQGLAQQTPPVPSPDQIAIPKRDQVQPLATPDAPAPSTVRIDDRGAIERPPCALEASPIRVNLTAVTFVTADQQPIAAELQALLAPLAIAPSGDQPISVVCRVRDAANARLSEAGYVALAQIPEQDLGTGGLTIQIVTARIVEVRILGDPGPFARIVAARIDQIRQLDPLNRRDAERILLQAGDIPGIDVGLTLSPAGGRAGDVIGTLTVVTRRVQLLANIQNFGSPQLGRWIGSLRGEVYGLTGLADRTFLSYSNATDFDEIRVLQAGHDFALNDHGLRAAVRGSLAWSRPDIDRLDLRSRSQIVSAELGQQLLRSVSGQLDLAGGFELLDQQTRIYQNDTIIPFTRDRLRMLFARFAGQTTLVPGLAAPILSVAGYAEIRKGLDILGASQRGTTRDNFTPSRFEGNPRATILRGELSAELRPIRAFTITAQAYGQWANDPLLNLEEFSLGNYTYGRGYNPGSNGGDRVYAFRVEPRVALPLGLPIGVKLTGFYDSVRLFNLDSGTRERNRLLRSIGGGVRIVKSGLFVVDALYARPLDRILSDDPRKPSGRFLLSITAQLLPWGNR